MEDDGERDDVEAPIILCADLDYLPFYRRMRSRVDPIGIVQWLLVCHFPIPSVPCGVFLNLTPGPSPFSSTKITPAAIAGLPSRGVAGAWVTRPTRFACATPVSCKTIGLAPEKLFLAIDRRPSGEYWVKNMP